MPLRILHILDSSADSQSQQIAADLARTLAPEFQITCRSIGPGGDDRSVVDALFRLRKSVTNIDLIHTFGRRPLKAALFSTTLPIIHTLPPEASSADLRWLRAAMPYRNLRIICTSDWDLRRAITAGLPQDRCSLIYPGVDFSRLRHRRNSELRQQLGFAEDDYVLLAAGETTPLARHDLALWTCGILSELDEHHRILLWGRGSRARSAAQRTRPWRHTGMARFAEFILKRPVAYEELLTTADMVLITGDSGVATLPVTTSMVSGLPIVSVTNRTTSEFLEDRHTAAMVGSLKPRELARRILDLRADASLQYHIADCARAEAYENFPVSKSLSKWRDLYLTATSTLHRQHAQISSI